MLIKDLVSKGLSCPMCRGKDLRGGYHEFQVMNSFICSGCGIRWTEDCPPARDDREWRSWIENVVARRKGGFVWVMHKTGNMKPIQDPRSSDETTLREFGRWKKKRRS